MADIKLTAGVVVANGPSLAVSRSVTLDAYDSINVVVPAGGSKDVEVQPGGAGRVQLLFILSSSYSDKLIYKINGGVDAFALDQPLLVAGHGGVALFTDPPTKLTFSNADTTDSAVQILVGRSVGA